MTKVFRNESKVIFEGGQFTVETGKNSFHFSSHDIDYLENTQTSQLGWRILTFVLLILFFDLGGVGIFLWVWHLDLVTFHLKDQRQIPVPLSIMQRRKLEKLLA